MIRQVVKLGFRGDETPTRVIVTMTTDFLIGIDTTGLDYQPNSSGPVIVKHRVPDVLYPVSLAVVSQPWFILEYSDYLAMADL